VPRSSSNTIVKFADDTVVVGLISCNNEKAYLEEFAHLSLWCQDESLMLNVSKTKELIVEFRRTQHQRTYTPLKTNGTAVERVSNFRYLGVHITKDLTWTTHFDTLVRKAKQQLRKFRVSRRILQTVYAGAVVSILTGSITAWFGNSSYQDRRALQRVVCSAEHTIGTTLRILQDLYSRSCRPRACKIMKDPHHRNNNNLFQLLR